MVDMGFFINELQKAKKILNPEDLKPKLDAISVNIETWTPTQIKTAVAEIIPSLNEFFNILHELMNMMTLQIERILGGQRADPVHVKLFPMYNWWHDHPYWWEVRIKNLDKANKEKLTHSIQDLRKALNKNDELDMDALINEAVKFKNSLTERELEQLKRAY